MRALRTGTSLALVALVCLYLLILGVAILWGAGSSIGWVMDVLGRLFT